MWLVNYSTEKLFQCNSGPGAVHLLAYKEERLQGRKSKDTFTFILNPWDFCLLFLGRKWCVMPSFFEQHFNAIESEPPKNIPAALFIHQMWCEFPGFGDIRYVCMLSIYWNLRANWIVVLKGPKKKKKKTINAPPRRKLVATCGYGMQTLMASSLAEQ